MFCKNCGTQIEDTWKVCPNCGTVLHQEINESKSFEKDISIETQAVAGTKKQIYKKWWFWFLIVFICIIGLLFSGGSDEDDEKEAEKEEIVTDFSNIDLEDFLNKSEEELKDAGFKESEEYLGYGALEGDVQISVTDGEIDLIIISGENDKTPSFHGVKPGMSEDEAYAMLAEAYPEELADLDGKMLANMDTKRSVRYQVIDGAVSTIMYMVLTDADIEDYQKSEEEYIFSDSDQRYLSEDEVRKVEVEKLAIGRNEIFARHGYIFNDESFKEYFENTSWYEGTTMSNEFDSDAVFNDFEKKNVELIKKIEDEINGPSEEELAEQEIVNEAYSFLVGHSFHLQDSQPLMVFESHDTIRYCWGGNIGDDYFNYSISSRYEVYKDDLEEWLTFLTIDGEEYYLRIFTNGTFNIGSMSGYGKLDGWYELYD